MFSPVWTSFYYYDNGYGLNVPDDDTYITLRPFIDIGLVAYIHWDRFGIGYLNSASTALHMELWPFT